MSELLKRNRHHLFVGGTSREPERGYFETLNPANGEPIAEVAWAGPQDVAAAVEVAREAFRDGAWRTADGTVRAATLRRTAELVRLRSEELARIETYDTGKPFSASLPDVEKTAAYIDFYSTLPLLPVGDTLPGHGGWRAWTRRVPYGVVAAIAPWNFAFRMVVMKTIPALACGNSIVLKTSELAPLAGVILSEILSDAGVPPGVFNVLHGDGETTGASLVASPGIDKITFTGSVSTGRTISQAAASQLTPCHLELGGKAPSLVFDDADVEAAADFIAQSALVNSGQICTAPTRLLVQHGATEAMVNALARRISELRWGDPIAEDTTFGPLISRDQLQRVAGFRERALEAGAHEVSPLEEVVLPGRGFWIRPSILTQVKPEYEVFQQEVFGPLITVTPFHTDSEGLSLVQDVPYALSANVFTTALRRRRAALDQLQVGTLWINSNTYRPVHTPFEGAGISGYGVDGGTDVADSFTRLETVIEHEF